VDPETTRFRLFDAAAEFLVGVARARPLVVALDDLHAADSPSLVLLRFVSEAVANAPVLVVGSYREHEVQTRSRCCGWPPWSVASSASACSSERPG
jgi:eukaryotic-like serine/threonine-protein kinase